MGLRQSSVGLGGESNIRQIVRIDKYLRDLSRVRLMFAVQEPAGQAAAASLAISRFSYGTEGSRHAWGGLPRVLTRKSTKGGAGWHIHSSGTRMPARIS